MLVWLFFIVRMCVALENFDIIRDIYSFRTNQKGPVLNLNQTYFSSLENYQVNAKVAAEKQYPWVAKVVHSRSRDIPYICTAACIHDGIFVTAARCISRLKVKHTSVIYKSVQLQVRAFVIPSYPSSQEFDDIGFIVIEKDNIRYDVVKLFDEVNRTDEAFIWYRKMNISGKFKVVGYATEKGVHRIKNPERLYTLKELPIVIEIDICPAILSIKSIADGFNIPCYHSCSIKEFNNKAKTCLNYHGVEGAAIVEVKSNKLFGLAIWGAYYVKLELPVGFSMLNSKSFYEDYECAKKIRVANLAGNSPATYQQFCD